MVWPLVPLAAKGLMWGSTAIGGVMGADAISKMPDNWADDAALKGPDARGNYNLNPIQRLFVDADSLTDRHNKFKMDAAKKDSEVRAAMSLDPSLQLLNGMDANDFLSTYSKQIRTAQQDEELTGAAKVQAQLYNSPQQVYERQQNREIREDANNLRRDEMTMANNRFATTLKSQQNQYAHTASENSKDRALTRDTQLASNDLAMQIKLMDSELADKRMAYDRETRRMDKRDRMIATLMSGIGQLGGAFAA